MGISNVNDHVTQRSLLRTVSGLVVTGPCRIYGIYVTTFTTTNGEITVYDNTSAAGDNWFQINFPDDTSRHFDFGPTGMKFETGLFIAGTGTVIDMELFYVAE